jgi:hypothetical protein
MRVAADAFKTGHSSLGEYYLHRIAGDYRGRDVAPPSLLSSHPTATPGMCDAVYSRILESLTLSPEHAVQLLRRGIDEEAIIRNRYGSVSSHSVMTALVGDIANQMNIEGVPGLYRWKGQWRIVAEKSELLIPVRDHRFRISALCRSTGDPARKYPWVSSKASPSGCPPHHAEPWNVEFRPVLFVTEGALKADVIAAGLRFTTIGLAGATNVPPGFGTTLRDAYPLTVSVFVAYDSDVREKPNVAEGRRRLVKSLGESSFQVRILEWNSSDGKGLDDVLANMTGANEA